MTKIHLLEPLAPDFEVERSVAAEVGAEVEAHFVDGPEGVAEAARGADGIVVKFVEVSGEAIAAFNGVKVIGRSGVGFDNIDLAAATAAGIGVINVPDYCVEEVASTVAAFVLADARRLREAEAQVRQNRWSDGWDVLGPITPLSEQVLGIVGLGRIGARVATMLQPFFATTLGCDPGDLETPAGVERCGLDELLERSDVVTLHCPLVDATRHLICRETLAAMRPGALLVNVARGGLIDQAALVAALDEGEIRSACLDVTDPEPPPADDPILSHPAIHVTNHCSWLSDASMLRNRTFLVGRVAAYLTGGDPISLVNPEVRG